ncbi:hypothetical protein [Pseudoglutamicibacter albus]|uniref:Uncharacterized protein n=1 Tax=Pseudoglutamicibacter albus TaxID=98671 RepID=A0ABU1YZJ1_9MICC|nr:hypothetical protein [Pseudoglutamicibacter albus]
MGTLIWEGGVWKKVRDGTGAQGTVGQELRGTRDGRSEENSENRYSALC